MNVEYFLFCSLFCRKGCLNQARQRDDPESSPLKTCRRHIMIRLNSRLTNRVVTIALAGYSLAFLAQVVSQYAA